ncbi:MAG: SpoVG family protein [bacterium]
MKITSIRIYPFDTAARGGKIRAVVDVELDGEIVIKGIRILESKSGGLFLGMPSIRMQNGSFRDLVVLKKKEFADMLRHSVLDAYRNYDHIHSSQAEGDADE